MVRKPKITPSFFKVLIKDYLNKLSLPHVFVQKYGKLLPESAEMRTSSGETWNVKLEEIDHDAKYCFTEGWNKFAKDLELEFGEFLVFWFDIGTSTFDVSVYGVDGCERQISAKSLVAVDYDTSEDFEFRKGCYNFPANSMPIILMETDLKKKRLRSCIREGEASRTESPDFGKETCPRFELVLTEGRISRVHISKKFAEAAGLIGKRAVVLQYPPKNRYWPVILDQRPGRNFRLELARGWGDFRIGNGLVFGRTYSFEFDPTKNVILVMEHNK